MCIWMCIVKIDTNFLSVCIRVVIKNKKSEIILPVFWSKSEINLENFEFLCLYFEILLIGD